MSGSSLQVYLFKSAPDEGEGDRFITALNGDGIPNQLVPVLVFEYRDLETLWRHLQRPAEHAGIVLTSPRCVQSISEAVKAEDKNQEWDELRGMWASSRLFCVGPSTKEAAKQLFAPTSTNALITGTESHAESLADKVIEVNSEEPFKSPLLYPCGSLRRDALMNKLSELEISCSQCTVYDTVKNPALPSLLASVNKELTKHVSQNETVVLVFFSPSGVKHVFEHLDAWWSMVDTHNVVAIGPTTKTALEEYFNEKGIKKQVLQCANPTPESLMDVLNSMQSSNS